MTDYGQIRELRSEMDEYIEKDAEWIKNLEQEKGAGNKGSVEVKTEGGEYTLVWKNDEVLFQKFEPYQQDPEGEFEPHRKTGEEIYVISAYDPAPLYQLNRAMDQYLQFLVRYLTENNDREKLGELDSVPPSVEDREVSFSKVDDLLEDIRNQLELDREETGLSDIKTLVDNREKSLISGLICSDSDDMEAVDKWFQHWNGEYVDSEVTTPHYSNEYILVRSEMSSSRTSGVYHAGWVVGVDREQPSGFFIHRMNHTSELEEDGKEWSKREIRQEMGYTKEYQGQSLEKGETYRVQGDIYLKKESQTPEELAESRAENTVKRNIKMDMEDTAKNGFYEKFPATENVEPRFGTYNDLGFGCQIRLDPDTDDLKKLAEHLGIKEETIRSKQEERGLKRLHPKTRKEIMEEIIEEAVHQYILQEEGYKNKLEEEKQDILSQWREEERQLNTLIGNHALMVSNGTQLRRSRRNGTLRFIIHDNTSSFIIHDEHQNQVLKLDKGVYEFDALERHQNR